MNFCLNNKNCPFNQSFLKRKHKTINQSIMKKKITKLSSIFLCLVALNAGAQTNTFPASGNVGIGITTPAATLHLNNGAGQTLKFLTGSNSGGYSVEIGVNDNGVNFSNNSAYRSFNFFNAGKQSIKFLTGTSTGTYSLSIGINDDGVNLSNTSFYRGFNFNNANGNLMSINYNGSVRIGAVSGTPAGYKLYVDQGILTEKVKVAVSGTASWADYVFHQEYELPSLVEVEKYIQQNKHLPGIPSAEEAVRDGIDLGQMNARLLAKIEELTLYMIEIKKENEKQQKEIEELKKQPETKK
jgi:hypothetical protein